MNIPVTEILFAAAALSSVLGGFWLQRAESRKKQTAGPRPEAPPARQIPTGASESAPAAGQPAAPASAPAQAGLDTIQAELLELRSTLGAMNNRIRRLQQQESLLLEALADPEEEVVEFQLIELAGQGASTQELMQAGGLSVAEADLLRRIHGVPGARARYSAY